MMEGLGNLQLILCLLTVVLGFSSARLEFSSKELRALRTSRPLVEDILTHDYQRSDSYLIGWLRAKKLDMRGEVQMLKTAQKWRKENKMDTILSETFPDFSNFEFGDDGVDYEGRTVLTKDLSKFDFRKVVLDGNIERFLRFTLYSIERLVSRSFEGVYGSNGTLTDPRLISINDFKGFSLSKHGCLVCFGLVARSASDLENYYPGIIGREVFINTPLVTYPFFPIFMKLFLSEETRRTIVVFGSDRREWSKYIQGIIPPDQLTYQFGGTRTS